MRGSCLQEVVAYNNFCLQWFDFWYSEKVVANKRWLPMRGGYKRRFDCITIFHGGNPAFPPVVTEKTQKFVSKVHLRYFLQKIKDTLLK